MNKETMELILNQETTNNGVFKYKTIDYLYTMKKTLFSSVSIDRFTNLNDNIEIDLLKNISKNLAYSLDKQIIETLMNFKNKKIIDDYSSNFKNEYSQFLFIVRKAKYENKKVFVNYEYLNYIKREITNIDELIYITENTNVIDTKEFSYMIINDLSNSLLRERVMIKKEEDIHNYSIVYKSYVNTSIIDFNIESLEVKEYKSFKTNLEKEYINIKKEEKKEEKKLIIEQIKKKEKINFNF